MSIYLASNPGAGDNVYSCRVSTVASGDVVTVVFPKAVNVVKILSDTDAETLSKWGGSVSSSVGTAAAPVLSDAHLVGPSHGPSFAQARNGDKTFEIKNVDSVTINKLIVVGWSTVGYGV